MRQKIRNLGYISPVIFFLGLGIYYVNGLWDYLSIGLALLGALLGLLYAVVCFDELKHVLSARSFRSGTNMLLVICLVLTLLVIVNIIGYRHSVWKDITVAKKYELSPMTRVILDDIARQKAEIQITSFIWTYIDRNLSQQQNQALIRQNNEREDKLRDLLKVYGDVCPMIRYRFLDPNRELILASEYNIQSYRGNVAIVEHEDHREMVADIATEEQVTNALIKVMSNERKVVYFLEGHQEADLGDGSPEGYLMVSTAIREQSYDTERLNVMETGGVPKDCKMLIIPSPKKPILTEELSLIDDYLAKGGRIMVLLDPEYKPGLEDWLLSWGVRVGDDIVVDNSTAGVRKGAGPTEPLLYSYDKEHPITRELKSTFSTMPTVRSVRLEDNPPPDLELTVLARTSDNSWGETDRDGITVKTPTFDPKDLSGPVPVAVSVLKKLTESKPGVEEIYSGPGGQMPSTEELKKIRLEKSQVRAELVVFGDSQFASNSYLRYGGNWDFFMNTANWLIGDERLIEIRPKNPEDQTIYITGLQSNRMAMVLQIVLPAVVLVIGGWVMLMRRLR
ncbi:MAG: Gldg family protein [Candidatus Glassbacteria bacterium]